MAATWILVTNEHRLRVVEVLEQSRSFYEVVDFFSPKGRTSNQFACNSASESASMAINPNGANDSANGELWTRDDTLFCKQVSNYLERARRRGCFTQLRIIAPLDFLNLLRNNMSSETNQSVKGVVVQDLANIELTNSDIFLRKFSFNFTNKPRMNR